MMSLPHVRLAVAAGLAAGLVVVLSWLALSGEWSSAALLVGWVVRELSTARDLRRVVVSHGEEEGSKRCGCAGATGQGSGASERAAGADR